MIEATQLRQAPARPAYVDRLVVLDDDPTGVQTLAGIRVLLAWDDPGRIAGALAGRNSVHLVTNTRALEPDEARTTVAAAARAALEQVAGTQLALRGRQHPAGAPAWRNTSASARRSTGAGRRFCSCLRSLRRAGSPARAST